MFAAQSKKSLQAEDNNTFYFISLSSAVGIKKTKKTTLWKSKPVLCTVALDLLTQMLNVSVTSKGVNFFYLVHEKD